MQESTEDGGVRIPLPPGTKELVTLHTPGAIPGIPGESHGPGTFVIDWDTRTIEALPPSSVPPGTVTITGVDQDGNPVSETISIEEQST